MKLTVISQNLCVGIGSNIKLLMLISDFKAYPKLENTQRYFYGMDGMYLMRIQKG